MTNTATRDDTNQGSRHLDCQNDPSTCRTERFMDRDLELTRCLESDKCRYKRAHLDMFICQCPEMRARTH